MSAPDVTLDAVLESYMLEADNEGTLATYLTRYPQFAIQLLDLAHQSQRVLSDEIPELDAAGSRAVDAALAAAIQGWPSTIGSRDLFADLKPADYGRLSGALGVPRQVLGAVRDGLAIVETIPHGWLRRFAEALNGSTDDLLASIGGRRPAASYKSEERPAEPRPVPFSQILVEAKVSEERRAEIMSDSV